MKMLSVEVDESFVKAIDSLIASSKLYSSRSEFLKDSIRKNFEKLLETDTDLRDIHLSLKELAMKAKSRGFDARKYTRKAREKFAREYLKSRGLKV